MPRARPGGLMFPRQWRRLSLLSMSVLFLCALGGACAGDTPTEPRVPYPKLVVSAVRSTISAGLAGLALMPSLETIAIFATKQSDGTVSGFVANVVGEPRGPVVELVPPHETADFWC